MSDEQRAMSRMRMFGEQGVPSAPHCTSLVAHCFPRFPALFSTTLVGGYNQAINKTCGGAARFREKQDHPNLVSKRAKQAAGPSLDEVRHIIRDKGLRCTPARMVILRHLFGAGGPVTHAQVADEVAPQGFDRATIYRNLVELADVGLLHRLELGDHVWRFELRQSVDQGNSDHTHFLCVDCGDVSCVPDLSLQAAVSLVGQRASPGRVTEVLLKGHCKRCQ
jgi:Fur family ferric uptake transcriptional regulator